MIPYRRKILIKALMVFDLLVMVFSFATSTYIVSYEYGNISFNEFLTMRVKVQNFVIFLGFIFIWHMIFSLLKIYNSKRLTSRWEEIGNIIKATTLGTIVILGMAILFRIRMVTPVFLTTFWVASSGVTILIRLVLRYVMGLIRIYGRNLRNMLIVGTNHRAVRFARKIAMRPELGYRLVGFADDEWKGIGNFQNTGYTLVADFNKLPIFLRDHVVDEVVIALPINSYYNRASNIIALCEKQGIIVRYLSDIFNTKMARSVSEQLGGIPLLSHYTGAMNGWALLIKRLLDFTISMILLLLLMPLFLLITLLIKITSTGPVFFVQERVGLGKRRFRLYKFRTMVPDAEKMQSELEQLNEVSGPVFKISDDPRITKVGKLLRKTSLDELPQLFNVLRGDMSLVGPRPLPVRDYNGFNHDWHRRRFSVRPGITCLWQISGRNGIPFDRWMELDMEYIDHWSLWLDLKILLGTIPAVLKGSGAS
jgi:exopolysaccharide biosynthesis polyprenyl glycosylphosphotransferase